MDGILAKKFIRLLHNIGVKHSHKKINDAVRGEKLALNFIKSEGGSTYPKEIEYAMGISSARVAAIIKKLEERGLVIREDDKLDGRKTLVSLTEKGKEEAAESEERVVCVLNEMFEILGKEDSESMVRILEKIVKNLPRIRNICEEKFKDMEEKEYKDS
ncbi:MarR family winged helix-turn-helix transcriptional regulator [uncultured Finegoldia sp.]|uniref:MarR family winged helix-turn-helix transcriptional regulator n=1 Tax=uncultured Finegoldia sp. TaxID=328009 RepID=UPI0026303F2E|nr:MarR family winged helix-turn-helix transcriptional regulator [uncultured Finegoldia sp.]